MTLLSWYFPLHTDDGEKKKTEKAITQSYYWTQHSDNDYMNQIWQFGTKSTAETIMGKHWGLKKVKIVSSLLLNVCMWPLWLFEEESENIKDEDDFESRGHLWDI